MTRYNVRKLMLTVALLAWAQAVVGQEKTAPTVAAPAKAGSAQIEKEMPSSRDEGITIHGHWTITVHNLDGSVVSRREFENSLTTKGKAYLLHQLAGYSMFPLEGKSAWQLDISGPLCTQRPGTTLGDCHITVGSPEPQPTHPGEALIISGTVRMDGTGQIMAVATSLSNFGGRSTATAIPITFSSRDLTQPDSASALAPVPINVQAGQNVDFSVSFTVP